MSLVDLVKYGGKVERHKIATVAVAQYRLAEANRVSSNSESEQIYYLGMRNAFGYLANELDSDLFEKHERIVNNLIMQRNKEEQWN